MKSIFRCTAGPLMLACVVFLLAATGAYDPSLTDCGLNIVADSDGVYNGQCPVGDGWKDIFCETNSGCTSNRCCTSEAVCTYHPCTRRNPL